MQNNALSLPAADEAIPSASFRSGPLTFLALCWLISGVGTSLPIADSFTAKLVLILPPVIISLVLTLLNPADGFALWSLGLGFLVTQTGYQAAIGDFRLSALECVLIVLGCILLWQRHRSGAKATRWRMPGQAALIWFTIYAVVLFVVSMIQHVPLPAALLEFKGFVLYPFMGFIVAAGLRDRKLISWSTGMIIMYYLYVGTQGILQFRNGEQNVGWEGVYRSSGDYASINTYGVTMSAICLLTVGVAVYVKDRRLQLLMAMASGWLFIGAVVSVARTVWVACACGVAVLLLTSKKAGYGVAIIALGMAMFLMLPSRVSDRINQLSDSSTVKREFYFNSGVQAWQERWLTGWGWGIAYWFPPTGGKVAAPDGIAWYHNDYLNLAEQAGAIGVALYGAYWLSSLLAARRWLVRHFASNVAGYVAGGQMALVVLLVAAGFEHVLWKPDIGGLVGWMSGLMLASMALERDEAVEMVTQ